MCRQKKLWIPIILLISAIIFLLINKSLYIICYYIISVSIFLIIYHNMKPKDKKGWLLFSISILIVDFVCAVLPSLAIIFRLLTTGKVLGYSYLNNISTLLHVLLIATWSTGVFICIKNKYKIRTLFIVIFVGLHSLVNVAFDTSIKEREYVVDSPFIDSAENPIVIAHITDLHSTIFSNEQQSLIDKLVDKKPDLIVLTGDIADDYTDFKGTALLLDGIKDIAPIYYVTGNHEYRNENFYEVNENIKSYGVIHLSDAYEIVNVKGNEFVICGIDDPDRYIQYEENESFNTRFEDLNQSVNFDGLKILLSHRPEKIEEYTNSDFDIILSGHAHGGQVRVPFLINGLYAPNQGLFPKYAGGEYRLAEDKYLFVSRGLAIGVLPRVFNPPEIVYIEIQ